ncbi:MAG: serine hydrolase [Rubricoccaceae bacterium]
MHGLLFSLLLLLGCMPAHAQRAEVDTATLNADIEALRAAYGVPGLALAVVRDGRMVYAKGFGYRDVEQQLPVTPQTVFPIGSVTKQLTAGLIGTFERDGRLSVTDRPAQHIPELRFRTDEMDRLITVADLLSHQSGIGNVDGTSVFFPVHDPTAHLRRLAHLEPETEVRERLAYSNMGYAVLAGVAERLSGASWENELTTRLFAPLRMDRSSASLDALLDTDEIAVGYGMIGSEPRRVLYPNQFEAGSSGAANSSAMDLSNWVTMLLNNGMFEGQQILTPEFIESAFSAQLLLSPSYDAETGGLNLNGYGYGFFVNEYEGRYRVSHGGNVSGFSSRVDLLPEENLGVVILTNQQNSNFGQHASEIAYRHMLSLPPEAVESYPIQVSEARLMPSDSSSAALRKETNPDAPPTHALAAYVGEYTDLGYGTFSVALRDGMLFADFPAFSFALVHEQANVFRLQHYYEIDQNSPAFAINFQTDFSGVISSVTIPLQAEPVTFTRDVDGLRAKITRQLEAAESLPDAEPARAVAEALRAGVESGVHTESSINALGYQFLQANELAMSLAVFRFNAERFASSWNAHDSLGEALAAAGHTAEAIAAYERSLELNPDNTNGRAILERLRSE